MKTSLFYFLIFIFLFMNCHHSTKPTEGRVTLLWKSEMPERGSAGITMDNDDLYFTDSRSLLYKIGKNGKGLQTVNIKNGCLVGRPIIVGNKVIVGTDETGDILGYAGLYVIDKDSMKIKWSRHNFIWGALPIADHTTIYCTDENIVYAFDLETGNEIWQQDMLGRNVYTPVIDGERLYFATGFRFKEDGYLYCLNTNNGEIIFQDTLPYIQTHGQTGGSGGGCSVWEDKVYVPGNNRYLYCFNKHTGEEKWKFLADAPLESPPRISDGIVYFGSLNCTAYANDAENGDSVWSDQRNGSIDRDPPQFFQDYVLIHSNVILIYEKNNGELILDMNPVNTDFGYFMAVWDEQGRIFATGYNENNQKRYMLAYQFK